MKFPNLVKAGLVYQQQERRILECDKDISELEIPPGTRLRCSAWVKEMQGQKEPSSPWYHKQLNGARDGSITDVGTLSEIYTCWRANQEPGMDRER